MSFEEIVEKFNDPNTTCIYGRMYGEEYIERFCNGNVIREKDKIIEIEKREVEFQPHHERIIWVWGWPGPDLNDYRFKDYGKTWAFNREELDGVDA